VGTRGVGKSDGRGGGIEGGGGGGGNKGRYGDIVEWRERVWKGVLEKGKKGDGWGK